jgi:hypothetical protein
VEPQELVVFEVGAYFAYLIDNGQVDVNFDDGNFSIGCPYVQLWPNLL